MSKDVSVTVYNLTNRPIKLRNLVTKQTSRLGIGESYNVTGNRGSDDDVIIGIQDPSLEHGQTVGRFRFENPDFGYSWMKSDWNHYNPEYAMRGYGKLSQAYKGYDYVVQSAPTQHVATGKLPENQKYVFGKSNPAYSPTPSNPSKGVWAFKAANFSEDKYLLSKGFTVTAQHEELGKMHWDLDVVNLNWYQNPVT